MLTDEDKEWISKEIAGAIGRVEEHLTRQIDSAIATVIESAEERLTERMRDMQTELLKAFLPFREEVALRENTLELRQNALEARQGVLDRRLMEIEKKLFEK